MQMSVHLSPNNYLFTFAAKLCLLKLSSEVLAFYFATTVLSASTKMSTEAAVAIVFGILQVGIGLAALWQQRQAQARQLQRKTPPKRTSLKRLTSFQI